MRVMQELKPSKYRGVEFGADRNLPDFEANVTEELYYNFKVEIMKK